MTIVQLVVVLYKEQNIENIQKQLAAYTGGTKSDTSEDESNTSSHCVITQQRYFKIKQV